MIVIGQCWQMLGEAKCGGGQTVDPCRMWPTLAFRTAYWWWDW